MSEPPSDPKTLEGAPSGTRIPLATLLEQVRFNDQGLVPAIAQDSRNQEVLMLAWMDRTAIERTLSDGYAWYYSRSRAQYWRKGETSGHLQKLVSLSFDCDADAVLLQVEQTGSACHTLRRNCFYLTVEGDSVVVSTDPEADPQR